MSRAASQPARAQDVRRWLPPDVGLGASRAQMEQPKAPTAEEIAAIEEAARRAGAEAGFREGFEAGYREGSDKAAQEAEAARQALEAREAEQRQHQEHVLSETVAALESVARELADPLANAVDELEPELLALVEALARRVIMDELAVRPELIQRVLGEALDQLPSRKHPLRLHLHPSQQSVLEAYAQSRGEQITWIPDPDIEPGGCLLESGPSRIDATLDARLRQGIDAIWGELTRPDPAPLEAQSESSADAAGPSGQPASTAAGDSAQLQGAASMEEAAAMGSADAPSEPPPPDAEPEPPQSAPPASEPAASEPTILEEQP